MIKILESKKSKEDIAIEGANLYTSRLNSKIIKPDQTLITTDDNYIPIPQFYAGRSIFITGGTGFIGKVLIEKLLRSCPEIRNIYVLIRPKKGQEVSERLDQLFNDAVFSTLRRKSPHQLNKVIPITGDMTLEELGISTSDQDVLCRNVSIVFHSAATVRFSEKLKLAVTINMLGTKRLVQLCQRMMSLDALIHVSTAYCNCDRSDVSEVLYPAPYKPEDIISLVNTFPDKTLEELTPALIAQKPNTYTLTKALAEHMLLKEGGNLPIAIVRPSIVTSTLREPLAGWTDNFNGPLGLLCAVNQGLLRTLICEEKCVADFVPVDIVVNLIITVAWRTASRKFDDPLIYNCCSGQRNPIRWGEFVRSVLDQSRKNPLEDCLWYPDLVLRRNQLLHNAHGFLAHYIPAYLLDMFARIVGKKPRMIEAQNKIAKFVGITQYFCTRQWHFRDDNVRALLTVMKEQDGETFAFDVCTIDWEKYIESYVMGFREYLSKQHPETVVSSRKRVMRLYYLEQLTKLLTGTLVGILLIANWEA